MDWTLGNTGFSEVVCVIVGRAELNAHFGSVAHVGKVVERAGGYTGLASWVSPCAVGAVIAYHAQTRGCVRVGVIGASCETFLFVPEIRRSYWANGYTAVSRVVCETASWAQFETSVGGIFCISCLGGWTVEHAGFCEIVSEVVVGTVERGLAHASYRGTISVEGTNWDTGLSGVVGPKSGERGAPLNAPMSRRVSVSQLRDWAQGNTALSVIICETSCRTLLYAETSDVLCPSVEGGIAVIDTGFDGLLSEEVWVGGAGGHTVSG